MNAPWKPGFVHWLAWAGGGSLAWVAAFLATFILLAIAASIAGVGQPNESEVVFFGVMTPAFAAGGAAAGLIQWAVLRRERAMTTWWIGGAAAGFASIGLVFSILDGRAPGLVVTTLPGLLGGAVLGTAQQPLLRGRVYGSKLWIPITTVAFTVGLLAGGLVSEAAGRAAREGLLPGLFVGIALTGLGYIWLRRRRPHARGPVVGRGVAPVARRATKPVVGRPPRLVPK